MKSFQDILGAAIKYPTKKLVVAAAHEHELLEGVKEAQALGLVEAILIGNLKKIKEIAGEIKMDLSKFQLVEEKDPVEAARKAVMFVRAEQAEMIMKGRLSTAEILRAVLDKEIGLRTGRIISHVTIFEAPGYDRLMFLTDAAMIITPTFAEKIELIKNAVCVANSLGITMPKVAALAGIEVVNPDMPATMEAAVLAKMNERGQIKGCIIDGPLSLDTAVSREAAGIKGMKGPVAGEADILLAPNLETGNVIYKAVVFFGKAKIAGVISGAGVPVILTSRADTHEAKLTSIALGVMMAHKVMELKKLED